MLFRFGAALLLVGVCSCAVQHAPPALPALRTSQLTVPLSRVEAGAEFDSLIALIEEVHPDPYTVVSRDSLRRARNALLAALPEPATRVAFAVQAQRLVTLIGDGHTTLLPANEEYSAFVANGGRTLPFAVLVTPGGLAVANSSDTSVYQGELLLRINDREMDSLTHEFGREMPAELSAWRSARIARSFATLLWAHDLRAPYTVALRSTSGATRTVTLAGMTKAQIDSANRARGRSANGFGNDIRYRPLESHVAYLDFTSMNMPIALFRTHLDSMFDRINRDSTVGIVIDIRRNGGGNSTLGDELLSYLTDRSYTGGLRKEWKTSARYRRYTASQTTWWLRWIPFSWTGGQTTKLFSGPAGRTAIVDISERRVPRANARRVVRPVCVLIGPGTFSSAVLFANSIKQSQLATLVGEPTGEPPNAFGEIYPFRLPRTGTVGQVSTAAFVLDPDTLNARTRGVLPDMQIARLLDDVRENRDPALEQARRCALNQGAH